MKVLQLCSKPPFPPNDGGSKAMHNVSLGLLAHGIDLTIRTISTYKHPFLPHTFPKNYLKQTKIQDIPVNTKITIKDAFLNLFSNKSYNIDRFYAPQFETALRNLFKENSFDIVLLESLYMTPYISLIRSLSSAKIIYREHNIEHEIWERNAKEENNPIKKHYFKLLAERLKKYELSVINKIDSIAAITKRDKLHLQRIGCKVPIQIFPFGINHIPDLPQQPNHNKAIQFFHIGSMDWKPNIEGISWILSEVWPKFNKENTQPSLHLAGRNMPKWLLSHSQKRVKLYGEVENSMDFINSHDVLLVPLFSGSGMRIKIIEAMILQKLVIATPLALEGIGGEHMKEVIIAENAEEFLQQMHWCTNNPKEVETIKINARNYIKENYSNDKIISSLIHFFEETIHI